MKKFLILILVLSLALTSLVSCDKDGEGSDDGGVTVNTDFELDESEAFTDRDLNTSYDESSSTVITLSGESANVIGNGASVSGNTVTINSNGSYIISGSLTGMIIVDAPEAAKPHIILKGASINSASSAALYVKECDKLVVTLEGENTLATLGDYVAIDENNIDAAVFSKQDLSFNGAGSLAVSSPSGHGIVSKDDLVIAGGSYTVNAASHGLDANDSVKITASKLNITAGKDGIHAENADDSTLGFIYINSSDIVTVAGGDGISAGYTVQIESVSFDISTSASAASDSYKGIKSVGTLLINGGEFKINSSDDALHSNTSAVINDGSFEISTGDDGVHADESLAIRGGVINITKSYEGIEALDIEISGGDITIKASDDGINAAGGNDESGYGGGFGQSDGFGGGRPGGRPGGMGGGMPGGSSSSNGSITISGGKIYMNASGDGIDANGSLTISGGEITVCGPTSGDTSVLDYDNEATITGGTFIGTGAQMMAQTFSSSSQGVLALTVGSRTAGTEITISDSDGNLIIKYSPTLSYQLVVISTPELRQGETYTVTVGSDSGEFEAK